MARFIAIEWSETEARLAVAGGRPGQAVFEHAFTISLQSANPSEETPQPSAGERIAAGIAARGLGRLPALVTLGRGNIELRQLSMPPAPDDELPDLVRFQAMREFGAMQNDWPLDFIPLDDNPEEARSVLAAAVAPEQMHEIEATCHEAGLKLQRVLLRPCSAASLYCQAHPAQTPGQVRLLIDLLGDEADLTVVCDQTVVFLRTARLSGDPLESADAAEVLESEIRRTVAAAQNLLTGQKIESLLLFGTSLKHNGLQDKLHKKFKLPAEVFDPFEGLKLKSDLRRNVPTDSDRFAPVLGALVDEFQRNQHAIDFLHPRRPPEQTTRKNMIAGIGLAAAVLLLGVMMFNFFQKRSLQAEVANLSGQWTELKKQVPETERLKRDAETVDKWVSADVQWLEQLRWIAEQSPEAQDVMFTQMVISPSGEGGQISLKGVVKDLDAYGKLAENLNDDTHKIKSGNSSEDDSVRDYSYQFDSTVYVSKEAK